MEIKPKYQQNLLTVFNTIMAFRQAFTQMDANGGDVLRWAKHTALNEAAVSAEHNPRVIIKQKPRSFTAMASYQKLFAVTRLCPPKTRRAWIKVCTTDGSTAYCAVHTCGLKESCLRNVTVLHQTARWWRTQSLRNHLVWVHELTQKE